jgi:hypothetical protein
MNGDRLNGRYCAVETADHSERAENDRRKTVENPAVRDVGAMNVRRKARSLYEFAALYWFTGD